MKQVERSLKLLAGLFVLAAWVLPLGAVQKVILEWDTSTDPTVVGYKVYYYDTRSTNVAAVDAGNVASFILTNLTETVNYGFYVTTYNSLGVESDPSNILEYTVPLDRLAVALTNGGGGTLVTKVNIPALAGKSMILQTSTDLINWTTVLTGGVGQSVAYQVTNRVAGSKQFFRSACLP